MYEHLLFVCLFYVDVIWRNRVAVCDFIRCQSCGQKQFTMSLKSHRKHRPLSTFCSPDTCYTSFIFHGGWSWGCGGGQSRPHQTLAEGLGGRSAHPPAGIPAGDIRTSAVTIHRYHHHPPSLARASVAWCRSEVRGQRARCSHPPLPQHPWWFYSPFKSNHFRFTNPPQPLLSAAVPSFVHLHFSLTNLRLPSLPKKNISKKMSIPSSCPSLPSPLFALSSSPKGKSLSMSLVCFFLFVFLLPPPHTHPNSDLSIAELHLRTHCCLAPCARYPLCAAFPHPLPAPGGDSAPSAAGSAPYTSKAMMARAPHSCSPQ